MGSAKEIYMEQVERGWFSLGSKYVCADCFLDDVLSKFVSSNAESNICDYCGSQSEEKIAAPIDAVIEIIARGIYFEWTDPAKELPYESREGGYQGDVYDTYDLFWAIEFPTENERLMQDVAESMALKAWCRRSSFAPPESKALLYSWEDFCHVVKHQTRYLFFPEIDEFEQSQFSYTEILDRIAEIIFEIRLLKTIPKGSGFYRGRIHDPEIQFTNSRDLGSPPIEYARYSNRMSPAGIPMFYGSLDDETIIAEIYDSNGSDCKVITIALFEAIRDLHIIDLTQLPEIPSLFSDEKRHLRGGVAFLHEFVKELSKPISKDGYEHIEYVPSQIVTESFRHKFIDDYGHHPDGILYPSSRNENGVSIVLFALNKQCVDENKAIQDIDDPILLLRKTSISRKKLYRSYSFQCFLRQLLKRIKVATSRLAF